MFRKLREEQRPSADEERNDLKKVRLLQCSLFNTFSIVHSSRGPIAVVKLDGELYVPSACVSKLASFDHDCIIDQIARFGIKVLDLISIPLSTEAHAKILQSLAFYGFEISANKDICLMPIAAAIRTLIGLLRADINIVEEVKKAAEDLRRQTGIDSTEHDKPKRMFKAT